MKEKIYVFLADGFEEIEALGVVDILKRANFQTVTVGINKESAQNGKHNILHKLIHSFCFNKKSVQTGAHNIKVQADILFEDADFSDGAAFVLPGGMPGSLNLTKHIKLRKLLQEKNLEKSLICAICAAPMALSQAGLLKGKTFTMYPGMTSYLAAGDMPTANGVETDDNIITGKGPGFFFEFACAIAEKLGHSAQVAALKKAMFYGEK